MNGDFALVEYRGVSLLVYEPWWREGLVHGTTCSSISFALDDRDASCRHLAALLDVQAVVIPRQSHTNTVIDLRGVDHSCQTIAISTTHADALIVDRGSNARSAFGVVTADCVPIVARSGDVFVLIHAGWRGLANGIIKKALCSLPSFEHVIVFPCAGSSLYEIGEEVLQEIGPSAVFVPKQGVPQKYLLDMSKTAQKQIEALNPTARYASAGICTIDSQQFHSFRRDGQHAGRNLTFVAL